MGIKPEDVLKAIKKNQERGYAPGRKNRHNRNVFLIPRWFDKNRILAKGSMLYLKRGIVPGCDRCLERIRNRCQCYRQNGTDCKISEMYLNAVVAWARNAVPWVEESDMPMVVEYAKLGVLAWMIDVQIEENGWPVDKGYLQARHAVTAQILSYASVLGFTPDARKKLGATIIKGPEEPKLADILSGAVAPEDVVGGGGPVGVEAIGIEKPEARDERDEELGDESS